MSESAVEVQETVRNSLKEHYRDCVNSFLRTVVVVDDRAFSKASSAVPVDLATPAPFFATLAPAAPPENNPAELLVEDSSHELDGPSLVRLFASNGVICSIIEPPKERPDQELVEEIKLISRAADVLVLDWELKPGDHTVSLNAITQIVQEDDERGGRLRFIAVYTAEKGRRVKNAICAAFGEGEVKRDGNLLRVLSACIVVLNKPAVGNDHAVPLGNLPDVIFDYFAQFSSGILPAAALSAIGTIRHHTHQILGQFHNELDGAFIAHRALIPKPDDAEMHLIELVADSLYNLMLTEGVREKLSDELCIARFRELIAGRDIAADSQVKIESCIAGFSGEKVAIIRDALGLDENENYPEKRFIEKMYGHDGVADSRRKEMAFLHDFTRSHLQKAANGNPPRLTLGSVVAIQKETSVEFQLCIQPRCDSVRFERVRAFPFTRLQNSDRPNIHFYWGGSYRSFSSSEKLFDIVVHEFGSEAPTPAVYAKLDTTNGKWFFEDSQGQKMYWVGDLRKDKAQRMASRIASRLHMPGINEYEPARTGD